VESTIFSRAQLPLRAYNRSQASAAVVTPPCHTGLMANATESVDNVVLLNLQCAPTR